MENCAKGRGLFRFQATAERKQSRWHCLHSFEIRDFTFKKSRDENPVLRDDFLFCFLFCIFFFDGVSHKNDVNGRNLLFTRSLGRWFSALESHLNQSVIEMKKWTERTTPDWLTRFSLADQCREPFRWRQPIGTRTWSSIRHLLRFSFYFFLSFLFDSFREQPQRQVEHEETTTTTTTATTTTTTTTTTATEDDSIDDQSPTIKTPAVARYRVSFTEFLEIGSASSTECGTHFFAEECYRVFTEFRIRLRRTVPGFYRVGSWFTWTVPSFTEFFFIQYGACYRVLPGFEFCVCLRGWYRVLPSFEFVQENVTGFYRVFF